MIRKLLDLSTAHLDTASRAWLDHTSGDGPVAMMQCGWFGFAPETMDRLSQMPECLQRIAIYARKKGCEFLLFDADGAVLEALPVYEKWEDDDSVASAVYPYEMMNAIAEPSEIDVRTQSIYERGVDPDELHPELAASMNLSSRWSPTPDRTEKISTRPALVVAND